MTGETDEPIHKVVRCPKCGAYSASTETSCTQCGMPLLRKHSISILAYIPAFIAACFFTLFIVNVTHFYHFLWWFLPLPWIAIIMAFRWNLVGGIVFILLNSLSFIIPFIIVSIDPGESLGASMVFLFFIVLYNGPLLTSAILLIVFEMKQRRNPAKQK